MHWNWSGIPYTGFTSMVWRKLPRCSNRFSSSRRTACSFSRGGSALIRATLQAVLRPDPSRLLEVLHRSPVPAYLWYYDRVHEYDSEPSRLEWMRRVCASLSRCVCHRWRIGKDRRGKLARVAARHQPPHRGDDRGVGAGP